MFRRLLQRLRPADMHRPVYERIVAQARQPLFYARLGAPDTVDGRFDMIVVHLIVALRACRRRDAMLAQGLVDSFFKDMEHSLREMGVSDVAIPKRMKQVTQAFYGRVAAYEPALEAGDMALLSAALRRNVLGGDASASDADTLARYILDSERLFEVRPLEELQSGQFGWARVAASVPASAGGRYE